MTEALNPHPTMVLVTADRIKVGNCVFYPREGGWRFIPAVSGMRSSRKVHATATDAIPPWAFAIGDDLLTSEEAARAANA